MLNPLLSDQFLQALSAEAAKHGISVERLIDTLEPSAGHAFFEYAPDPMLILDSAGRIMAYNRAYRKLVGEDVALPNDESHWDIVHPDDRPQVREMRDRLSEGKQVPHLIVRARDSEGRYVWLEWSVSEHAGLYYCIGRNISQQRKLETDLANIEQSYTRTQDDLRRRTMELQNVVQNTPIPIARIDRSLRYILINQANERSTGIPIEQMLGRRLREIIASQRLADLLENWLKTAFETGESQRFTFDFVTEGARKYFDTLLIPEWNEQGEVETVLVVSHDITAQRQLERQLRERETWYRGIVESQVDLVSRHLPDTTIVFVNDAYCKYYGFTRDELMGRSFLITEAPEIHAEIMQKMEDVIRIPGPHNQEIKSYHPDGTPRWIEWVSYAFTDEVGSVTMIQSVGRDITTSKQLEAQRLELEEQRHRNRMLEIALEKEREIVELRQNFTSMITHEFRTPLAVIQSTIEILRMYLDRLPVERLSQRLDIITKQAQRMNDLLSDILTYSRGERKLAPNDIEDIELTAFCHEMADDFRLIDEGQHPIALTFGNGPLIIRTDRRLFEHIYLNLVGNAIKYSPPGAPVDVSIHRADDKFIITVSDKGIGIPEADFERIFTPFHRAANVGSRSGSGLGLPIVKQCVEGLGGSISLVSQLGVGTIFTVVLPAEVASD